jgi:hypothetical protein
MLALQILGVLTLLALCGLIVPWISFREERARQRATRYDGRPNWVGDKQRTRKVSHAV